MNITHTLVHTLKNLVHNGSHSVTDQEGTGRCLLRNFVWQREIISIILSKVNSHDAASNIEFEHLEKSHMLRNTAEMFTGDTIVV